jgi:hypothetical protein
MASINNRIFLAGQFRAIEQSVAATNILPGMLIQTSASTTVSGVVTTNTVTPHSTAGGFAAGIFAIEDALQGRTVTDTYYKGGTVGTPTDNGQVLGDMVQIIAPYPGAVIMALLLAGTHYTVGMQLISDGAGRLKQTTGSPSMIIGEIVDDIDLSASGALNTLGKIRIWQ